MSCDIAAGGIYKIRLPLSKGGERSVRPALAMNSPDGDGDVRFYFVTARPPADTCSQFPLKREDYETVALPHQGYLRLEKAFFLPKNVVVNKVAQLTDAAMGWILRALIKSDVPQFALHSLVREEFLPGRTSVPVSGKVLGAPEIRDMVDASLDAWLTSGRFNNAFESRLKAFLGVKFVLTTNSGSSANLLAFSVLTSPALGDRAILAGDEVITVAAGFPTTVNPILQFGAVPVFVDVSIPTYNIDPGLIEAAISGRTKAIILAHTLGNPFNVAEVTRVAKKYGLWLIEDCCDALGATYDGCIVGTFGDIATLSFYPAHHITMGEGGAVFTNNEHLAKLAESFRDWGRDCYCAPGRDNTCGKRFEWQLGSLPKGYDHKYTYSHLGYNLKITDLQAAAGLSQIERLPFFIETRRRNFNYLKERLSSLSDHLILPERTAHTDPSWFGFPITIRNEAFVTRVDLLRYLDQYKIATRLIFAGNLIRQPYFSGRSYKVSGTLAVTDTIMTHSFWLGVYPGLTEDMLDYVGDQLEAFFGLNI